jgi:hypothetical protein
MAAFAVERYNPQFSSQTIHQDAREEKKRVLLPETSNSTSKLWFSDLF